MSGCNQPVELFAPAGITEYIALHQRLCQFTLGYPLHIHEISASTPTALFQKAINGHPEYLMEWQPLSHGIFTAGFALVEATRPGRFDVDRAEQLGVPNGPERSRLQYGESIVLPNGRRVHPEEVLGPPRQGIKIAYVLDTRPCIGGEKLAQNADALITDATFPVADAGHAHESGHSTAVDAAELARRSGVQRLFLTHFSGRLTQDDLPALVAEAGEIFPNSEAAMDLAKVTITPKV